MTAMPFCCICSCASAVAAYPTAASGAIADVYAAHERGEAMGILTTPALVGPIIGEVLSMHTGNLRFLLQHISVCRVLLFAVDYLLAVSSCTCFAARSRHLARSVPRRISEYSTPQHSIVSPSCQLAPFCSKPCI